MKKMVSAILSFMLVLGFTAAPSFATTGENVTAMNTDQLLVDKIIEKDTNVLYEGNRKIEKVSQDDKSIQIGGLSEKEMENIQKIDLYKIQNVTTPQNGEETATIVADMYLQQASAGTEHTSKKCGRVTVYMEWSFSKKTFKGLNCIKLTKTGGKVTKKENAGLVIRKLKSTYKGYGTYFTSAGKKVVGKDYVKSKSYSTSSPGTLKTWNTSGIDRYYDMGGTGILQTRFYVTYGGSSASQQATYYVSYNLANHG